MCKYTIDQALVALRNIEAVPDALGLALAIWIVAFVFFGIMFIFQLMETCFLCCRCCHNSCCKGCHSCIMALFYMALGITFFVLSLINISQFAKKVNVMRNWVDYAPCVDIYM